MQNPPKFVVLSIDGVPHGLLVELMQQGYMPNMAGLCEQSGQPRMMRSVQPTVSCSAWASYATGVNPGKHGIFGFIDRRPGSYDMSFPNAANLKARSIWEILSEKGKKVFGMNVPASYPPKPVNGVLIGGFLAPSPLKAAWPPEAGQYLQSIDYRVDSDAQLARESKTKMLGDLDITLAKRAEAMFHFLETESWDFFHTHIMGTDRINHFLMSKFTDNDPEFAPAFREYYRKVDVVIGELLEKIGPETPLAILSDHGFCPIKYEVQLSKYMVDTGWTKLAEQVVSPLSFDPAATKAFTLIPGRIYVNLQGREAAGCVPRSEYDQVRSDVTADLMKLCDPAGNRVIKTVLKREDVYWPSGKSGPTGEIPDSVGLPPYGTAPDLVAVPFDGYDLKLGLTAPEVFMKTQLEGMHTYHDALLVTRDVDMPAGDIEIRQLAGPILRRLGVTPPDDMDVDSLPAPAGVI